MICPKCGERNPDNFRFCGMCGTTLEAPKAAAAPRPAAPKVEPPRQGDIPIALRIPANPPRATTTDRVPSGSGPSVAGLAQPRQYGPTLDSLREKSFSGMEPKFLYEEPTPKRGRTLLLAVVLVILGIGVWARYHFVESGSESAKPETTANVSTPNAAPNAQTPPKQAAEPPTATPAQPKQTAGTPTAAAQPESSTPAAAPVKQPAMADKSAESHPKPQAPSTPTPARTVVTASKPTKATRPSEIRPVSQRTPAIAKPAPADDTGAAAFRRGEAYLYGRGVAENCDEAIRNLKAASASGNAKARSTFGTMYATGHCVPRDLPTSYSWFALALRADPNNQILEQDLNAIWNQMTPPERQLATKIKQ